MLGGTPTNSVKRVLEGPSDEQPTAKQAINGRLEHLRGSALGFRNLTNYIAWSLLETGGFRPVLSPESAPRDGVGRTREPTEEQLEAALDVD